MVSGFASLLAAGGDVPLHVGLDKIPRQIKLEMQARRIRKELSEKYTMHKWFVDRDRGWISAGWEPIFQLDPKHGREATIIKYSAPGHRQEEPHQGGPRADRGPYSGSGC